MTITLPDIDVTPDLKVSHGPGSDEPDGFSHYVKKGSLTDAYVFGSPVEALCGRKWVPTRDPKKYPVCADCKRIFDQLPEGDA